MIVFIACLLFLNSKPNKNRKINDKHPVVKSEEKTTMELKGEYGEGLVIEQLKKISARSVNLNNLLLKNYNNTTQVDHVLIGEDRTVFVIETKHYKGIIRGSEEDKYWHQHLGNYTYSFYNPIKQNNTHVNAINYLLKKNGVVHYKLVNIVVFSNEDCELDLDKSVSNVLRINELNNYLINHMGKSYYKSNNIEKCLLANDLSDDEKIVQEHKNYVRNVR